MDTGNLGKNGNNGKQGKQKISGVISNHGTKVSTSNVGTLVTLTEAAKLTS